MPGLPEGPERAPTLDEETSMAHILVCENSPTEALRVRLLLDSLGHDVILAEDGLATLELLRNAACDLVLLDVRLPFMNGIEVCRRIRLQRSAAALPVILITDNQDMEHLRQGHEAGANTCVVKPFDPDDLLRRIDNFLPHREKSSTRFAAPEPQEAPSTAAARTPAAARPPATAKIPQPGAPPTPAAPLTPISLATTLSRPMIHLPSALPRGGGVPLVGGGSPLADGGVETALAPAAQPLPGPPSPESMPQALERIMALSEKALCLECSPRMRELLVAMREAALKGIQDSLAPAASDTP